MSAYSFSYKGTINRTQFFNRSVILVICNVLSFILITGDPLAELLAYFLIVFSFFWGTQTWIRRAHDLGKSSYYVIWGFIPIACLAAWIHLQFKKGKQTSQVIKSDDTVPVITICFLLLAGHIYVRYMVNNSKKEDRTRQEAEINEMNRKRADEANKLYLENKQLEEKANAKIKLNQALDYCVISFHKQCQLELFYAGYNPGVIDGIYGEQTMNAWNRCYSDGVCGRSAPAIY